MLKRAGQRGLTLVELMIGIAIVGILLAAGVQTYGKWTQNQQVRVAADSIVNGMQVARSDAVRINNNVQFVLGTQSAWTVTEVISQSQVQARSQLEGTRNAVVSATPAGATTATFNEMGRVVANADGSAALTQIDVSNPFGDRPLRITLSTAGSTRMCDPSPLLQAGDPRKCP
ncbi:MAG: GspH/FimT family pseudopilin [Pseudomonadota bacterium]